MKKGEESGAHDASAISENIEIGITVITLTL